MGAAKWAKWAKLSERRAHSALGARLGRPKLRGSCVAGGELGALEGKRKLASLFGHSGHTCRSAVHLCNRNGSLKRSLSGAARSQERAHS